MKKIMSAIFGLVICGASHAQSCISDAIPTAPSDDFVALTITEMHQVSTGLVWRRCAEGQTWSNDTCTGDATKFTWQEALLHAHAASDSNQQGWRLPNIKELSALTERLCVRPSINASKFPGTPPDDFWTSTPSMKDPERAWVVAFFNASHSIKAKDRTVYVRLVRTYVAP